MYKNGVEGCGSGKLGGSLEQVDTTVTAAVAQGQTQP